MNDFFHKNKNYFLFFLTAFFAWNFFFLNETVLAYEGSQIWKKTNNPGAGADHARAIAVDNVAAYVVGDDGTLGVNNHRWRIEKRDLVTGNLITDFGQNDGDGEDGVVISNLSSGDDEATAVAVDSTGVYIVGYDYFPGNAQWRIEKRNLVNGSIIWQQTENLSDYVDIANGVAVDSTGIYVAGASKSGGDTQWRIEKRNKDNGGLIWGVNSDPTYYDDAAQGVAVDSSGVYIVGYSNYRHTSQENQWTYWRVEKRDLDTGGLNWSQTIDQAGSKDDYARGVAVDSTGIYVAGVVNSNPGPPDWRTEKRNKDNGGLIWGVNDGMDIAYGVAVDNSGVYVVGTSGWDGYVIKRRLDNGGRIWGRIMFATPGEENIPLGMAVNNLALDKSGLYVVGYDSTPGDFQWRIERLLIYIDIGLRAHDGTGVIKIPVVSPGWAGWLPTSLRIAKGGSTYGVVLVELTDNYASKMRIKTSSDIKAVAKLPDY